MPLVNWTFKAEASLDDIYDHIAHDAPYYAGRFVQQIIDSVDQIEIFLLCGRTVPEAERDDIREIIYHGYHIIYWVIDEEHADILSVIHSSSDLTNPNNQPWDSHQINSN